MCCNHPLIKHLAYAASVSLLLLTTTVLLHSSALLSMHRCTIYYKHYCYTPLVNFQAMTALPTYSQWLAAVLPALLITVIIHCIFYWLILCRWTFYKWGLFHSSISAGQYVNSLSLYTRQWQHSDNDSQSHLLSYPYCAVKIWDYLTCSGKLMYFHVHLLVDDAHEQYARS